MQFYPDFSNTIVDTNTVADLSNSLALHTSEIIAQLSPANKIIFQLLPLFLSVNHPLLPGYIANYQPGRVCHYELTPESKALLEQLFSVGQYRLLDGCYIDGLYTIGSVGSVGQSQKSDWDIWLCCPEQQCQSHRQQLTEKCAAIERWANQIGVELHLFLVTQSQFKQQAQSQLDRESSGSAQHWLLLDEFYRSAITIAGKPIFWQQLDHNAIDRENFVDFGDIPTPPAQEYFGAMLWQLYKGIDAPEKSLLKALLLESYFSDFPNTQLLSQQWKEQAIQHQTCDHYLLLLQRITEHLHKQNDLDRLELVRECFYLKCTPGLSYLTSTATPTYQQQQLLQLVEQWQFSDEKVSHLDRAERWDPVAVQQHHQRLVAALLKSYQLLKAMAQRHNIDEALYPQEMAILSRKLYSAYQTSSTKINLLPSKALSPHTNPDLYFRRAVSNQQGSSWLLLNQAPVFGQDYRLQQDKSLIKLLGWAAINSYASPTTQVELPADIAHWSPKISQALQATCEFFAESKKATKNALVQASQLEEVLVILNMRDDASSEFNGQPLMMNWIKSNVFSIGSDKHSLVSSIDLIYRNSWNEYHALDFSGDQAILELLSHLFSLISSSRQVPKIKVSCVGLTQQRLLRDKVSFLLQECLIIRSSSTRKGIKVKSLVVAGRLYGLFFHPDKVEYQAIGSALELYQKLNDNALTLIPNDQDEDNTINQLIAEHASSGYIQFFLEKQAKGIEVYILDERNNLSSYLQQDQDELTLIRSIYRFYTFTKDQQNISQENLGISFNLPQFNRITRSKNLITIEPFDRHSEEQF